MNQSLTGIKRLSLYIKLCGSGFGAPGVSVDNHELDLANAKAVANEVSNGALVQQGFRMMCNCGRAREVPIGDQRFISRLGEQLKIKPRAKKHHYRQLYRPTICENSDRVAKFKFHHNMVPTGRPIQLFGHSHCVH